ncbi:MAG: deoxyhypusine synthase family protein [Candidatus Thermoplasmatota archaeon]|jgi:deoxyhypusine synthase|nr:deoxyhypusine synthase family protein [Candidatus Thermoplasmatota archaeon]MCL5963099.1 deoxyhypusine synthase family protein [Candidatus Thermoplasmatota archaeon]
MIKKGRMGHTGSGKGMQKKNRSVKYIKKEVLKDRVVPVDLDEVTTIKDLVESFKNTSIQSRNIGLCASVYKNMLTDRDRPTIILGMSGALIAGGLRKIIRDMIVYKIVDVIVSTGAIVYQDIYNARGFHHYIGSPDMDNGGLHDIFVDRIYDTLVDEEKFRETDKYLGMLAENLDPRGYSSREFIGYIGSKIDDKYSIVSSAYKHGVPIFVPALNDSSIGIGLTEMYARKKGSKHMYIDPIKDTYELTMIKAKSKKTGVIYLGGGTPKNYINDVEIISEELGYDTHGHDYAFQITTDSPHWGGLSGSTLEEAQSWGKIWEDAKKATVYSEITIALPLIVGYILQSELHKNRKQLKCEWTNLGDLNIKY